MAYLTLVYLKNIPENEIREAVHLVVAILRDTTRVEESFFPKNAFSDEKRVYIINYTN